MFHRSRQLFSRILLAMMLATFLSPALGWGMVASHAELSHDVVMTSAADLAHDHHHPAIPDSAPDHQDAHSSIGHLLTHMPAGFFGTPALDILPVAQAECSLLRIAVVHISLEPPLRPPKAILPN